MNWWLPLLHSEHVKKKKRRGMSSGWGAESAEVSDSVHQWVTDTDADRKRGREKEREEESESRLSPWEIFKSCGDKRVRVITHPECPLWFMDWDRNWLTERRTPLQHTHTLAYVLVHRANCWLGTLGLLNSSTKGLLSPPLSCSLFLSPSSVSLCAVSPFLSVRRNETTQKHYESEKRGKESYKWCSDSKNKAWERETETTRKWSQTDSRGGGLWTLHPVRENCVALLSEWV